MAPTNTAFKSSPDRGQGLARDTRVRGAPAEVGQAYDVRLVTFAEMNPPAHMGLPPFGCIHDRLKQLPVSKAAET